MIPSATTTAVIAAHGHGSFAGAEPWMWAIWAFAIVASVWSIWSAVRSTLRPGEHEPDHVKRSILDDDAPTAGGRAPATAPNAPGAPRA